MIPVRSIFQWRLLKFGFYFIVLSIVWSLHEWTDEGSVNPFLVLIPAVLLALVFVYITDISQSYQTELFVKEESVDTLIGDLESLGFRKLLSKKNVYMVWKDQLAEISDEGFYYKVTIPKRFELACEQYRSI